MMYSKPPAEVINKALHVATVGSLNAPPAAATAARRWHAPVRQLLAAKPNRCGAGSCLAVATSAALGLATTRRRQSTRTARRACLSGTIPGVRIEEATLSDVDAAAGLSVRSLNWTKDWFSLNTQFSDSEYEYLTEYEGQKWRPLYFPDQRRYSSTLLVAKVDGGADDGKVIGVCGLEMRAFDRVFGDLVDLGAHERRPERSQLRPCMAPLAVSPEYRGKGIARALIEVAEDAVRSWGYKELTLLVEVINQSAIEVYKKSGFEFERILLATAAPYLKQAEAGASSGMGGGGMKVEARTTMAWALSKRLVPEEGSIVPLAGAAAALLAVAAGVVLLQPAGEEPAKVVKAPQQEDAGFVNVEDLLG
mmetsp:Transcript_11878/g.27684  ORF Transcript_11878/g.27684 Transcript_11878/m.27684 type:complete len:364 (+) Transcript_11878:74-1165(+)